MTTERTRGMKRKTINAVLCRKFDDWVDSIELVKIHHIEKEGSDDEV